jgi:hypothetical protein
MKFPISHRPHALRIKRKTTDLPGDKKFVSGRRKATWGWKTSNLGGKMMRTTSQDGEEVE